MAAGALQTTGPKGQKGWNWTPAGGAQGQAEALRTADTTTGDSVNAATPVNPMQQESYGAAKDYAGGLAAGTNEEITRELGRARDEISVGMESEGEQAMGRGADPTLFKNRRLAQGKRDIHALQGRLADVALGRRAEAVGLQSGAANAAAGEQRQMHLGSLSAQLEQQRALTEQSEVQSRLNEAPYDRLMKMMTSLAADRGGGGGGFYDTSDVGMFGGGGGAGSFGVGGMGIPRGLSRSQFGGRAPSSVPQMSSILPMF